MDENVGDQKNSTSGQLTAQQRRFWVLEQLEQNVGCHHVPLCLRLRGELDTVRLDAATRIVSERHDATRCCFAMEKDTPRVSSCASPYKSHKVIDLTSAPRNECTQVVYTKISEEIQRPFDLQNGPLFRAILYRLAPDDHLYLLILHRIICDATSAQVLAQEIASVYAAGGNVLSSDPTQSSDYVRSQTEYLASESAANDLTYWKGKLQNAPSGLELPTDRSRALDPSFRGAEQRTVIAGDLLHAIRTFSDNEGTATFLTLLTTFFCLLGRYTGAEDIVIGTDRPGRSDPSMAEIIGPLSNQLALRSGYSSDWNFREMLDQVTATWNEAEQHQRLPFGTLLDSLSLRREVGRHPLFQVSFNQGSVDKPRDAAGVRWEPVRISSGTETLDLRVEVIEHESELELYFSYSIDLFEPSTIERMIGHFRALLRSVIENPQEAVSRLGLLTESERRQLVVEWNDTRVAYPRDIPLQKLIEQQVKKTPESIALVYESQHLTYRQLNHRANQLARYLQENGVGPDVLVGVCAERSLELVIALLASMKAGGAYLPLDPEYPKDRLQMMLEDANPPVVLTQAHLLNKVPIGAGKIFCLDRDWSLVESRSGDDLPDTVGGKNLAYAIYTSGSTGKPKGVPNVHEGIVNRLLWMQDTYHLTEEDRVLQKTPFSFDVSVWEFFWPLLVGARLVVARPGGHRDPAYLVNLISDQGITTLHFVPSMLSIFMEADGLDRCRSVRRVFASGEALPFELQHRFFERMNSELHNLYGPTEAAVDVTYWPCRPDNHRTIVPIGRPVANTQIYILDQLVQPVPVGVAGELHIGGIQLARGYLNRSELTAEKFIPDPFCSSSGGRLYKTGDLARFLPDGNIEYLGRIDFQVKLRGFRIELGEVEAALAECRGVRQAVVTVREDRPGDKRLVAYLLAAAGETLDFEAIKAQLKGRLPEYMVPSRFLELQQFPMTTSGKVDRKALPVPPALRVEGVRVAPRTEMESKLATLFARVLGLVSVGVTDDFFDLGGHSLSAARLINDVKEITSRQIPLSAMFRNATVESLAQLIEKQFESIPDPVLMEIQRGNGEGLAFFAIVPPGEESLGYAMLARHMGPEQTVYKIQGRHPVTRSKRPYTEDEMTALSDEYIAAMRSVQPTGPYCLGGLCDGTHIAEQIVLKLESQGEKVGLFAIFDTWVLQHSQNRVLWKLHYYGRRLSEMKEMSLSKRLASYRQVAENKIQNLVGSKPARVDWRQTYWPESFIAPRFRAPVVLFKRPRQPFYYVNDPQMGWGARSGGGVEIHEVDFSHAEILREPQVGIFGKKLADYVARIGRGTVDRDGSLVTTGPGRRIS